MRINVDNTSYINFDPKGFYFNFSVKYRSNNCSKVSSYNFRSIKNFDNFKYLGVTSDEKLSWGKHISELHNKLKFNIKTFYFKNNFCNYFFLLYTLLLYILVFTMVFLPGDLISNIWIDRIRTTQNHYLRIIFFYVKSSFQWICNCACTASIHFQIFETLLLLEVATDQQTITLLYKTNSAKLF